MGLIRVSSNNPSFKTVEFKKGLNIILADRTSDSGNKESRNGLGKTSLIQIIDFCLGSSASFSLFKSAELKDWSFTLDLSIGGKKYSITRYVGDKRDLIVQGDTSHWLIRPSKIDNKISLLDFNQSLGKLFFDISKSKDFKYKPSFRSCISYFIRKGAETGGYQDPFQFRSRQKEWNKQLVNAYLLGLDWQIAKEWQELKDKNKLINQLKGEDIQVFLRDRDGDIGDLEAQKITLEEKLKRKKVQWKSFNVHPHYKDVEIESNNLTEQIHKLCDDNIVDRKQLENNLISIEMENTQQIDAPKLLEIYEEAQVILPENIKSKINEVMDFHARVIQNRKQFLEMEVSRLKNAIEIREEEKKELSEKRSREND